MPYEPGGIIVMLPRCVSPEDEDSCFKNPPEGCGKPEIVLWRGESSDFALEFIYILKVPPEEKEIWLDHFRSKKVCAFCEPRIRVSLRRHQKFN